MIKHLAVASTALVTLSLTGAHAAGLDRSGQSVLSIFDDPNTFSFSVSQTSPSVTGSDVNGPGTYDAGGKFTQVSATYANDITDQLSYAVIYDQPFGSDVLYNANPLASALGGTEASLTSDAISFILKYQYTDRISVFGGMRAQTAGGIVKLNGQAYANALSIGAVAGAAGVNSTTLGAALQGNPQAVAALGGAGNVQALGQQVGGLVTQFNSNGGYSVDLSEEVGIGYTFGAAYEIPDIALRLAITYHSEIVHESNSTERFGFAAAGGGAPVAGITTFASPQSVNIDFQTGLNERTLLIAGFRWTDWDDFDVIPPVLQQDLASIDDGYSWSLGVARRFTENFVGLASVKYEKDPGSATVSPLGPSDGLIGLSLGGRYSSGNLNVSGGVNYTIVGDAIPGVAGQPVALFTDNSAVSVGFKIDYKF